MSIVTEAIGSILNTNDVRLHVYRNYAADGFDLIVENIYSGKSTRSFVPYYCSKEDVIKAINIMIDIVKSSPIAQDHIEEWE